MERKIFCGRGLFQKFSIFFYENLNYLKLKPKQKSKERKKKKKKKKGKKTNQNTESIIWFISFELHYFWKKFFSRVYLIKTKNWLDFKKIFKFYMYC